jgi:MacB-like periplasmic core domain
MSAAIHGVWMVPGAVLGGSSHFGNEYKRFPVREQSRKRGMYAYSEFRDLLEKNQVFSGLLAVDSYVRRTDVIVEGARSNEPEHANVTMVSGDYFKVLGIRPFLGRTFRAEVDKVQHADPVAVISYGYWKSRFAGAASIIGHKIRLRRTTFSLMKHFNRDDLDDFIQTANSLREWIQRDESLSSEQRAAVEAFAVLEGLDWQVCHQIANHQKHAGARPRKKARPGSHVPNVKAVRVAPGGRVCSAPLNAGNWGRGRDYRRVRRHH